MLRRTLFPIFGALLLVACGSAGTTGQDVAELDEELAADSEDALKADGRSTFYLARHDFRRCASPMCGGYFVRRVNYPTTRCNDGSYQAECYVSELQLPADLAEHSGESLYRGTIASKTYASLGRFGVFKATEVWSPDADTQAELTGTFYRVESSGIMCVRAPCPSLKQSKLNSSAKSKNILSLGFAGAPGTDDQHQVAASEAYSSAILAVGANVLGKEGVQLAITQYYRRVQPVVAGKPEGETCGATSECGAGLECCYPCGIQGCTNRCMPPAPGGGCPLFP